MKKINTKMLINSVAVALSCIILTSCAGSSDKALKDGVMRASNEHLYYNTSSDDIYRRNIETGEVELFTEGYTLLDVTGDEILVKNNSDILVLDANSKETVFEAKDFDVEQAKITEEYLYYKNEQGILYRMVRETGECVVIPLLEDIPVEKFDIYDKADIFFTSVADRIIRYNPDTGLMTTYAEELKALDFTVNDGYLLYIDEADNNSVYAINLETNDAVRFKDLSALRLEYKKEIIFYFDNADGDKAAYEIKTLDSMLSKQ